MELTKEVSQKIIPTKTAMKNMIQNDSKKLFKNVLIKCLIFVLKSAPLGLTGIINIYPFIACRAQLCFLPDGQMQPISTAQQIFKMTKDQIRNNSCVR